MSNTAIPTADPTSARWNNYVNAQSFNVTGLDGTPTTLSFPDINELQYEYVTGGIVSGFAIGFCSMLIIVLLLITPAKRRHQPIFILNFTSLILLTVEYMLVAIISSSSYSGPAPQLLGSFFAYGPYTWAPIVIQSVVQVFLYASIMNFTCSPDSSRVCS